MVDYDPFAKDYSDVSGYTRDSNVIGVFNLAEKNVGPAVECAPLRLFRARMYVARNAGLNRPLPESEIG